ncbi:hypothetical protein BX616_005467 [Lobosporangium transversale]|nr:hypothetical protein BX616_005467 [Lobosporangium transversale]
MPPILLEQFQSLLTTDRHICQTLRSILVQLPYQNYIVLSYLCHHLSKIAAHSDKTKMTVSNLALVFAPTLAIGSVLFKALLGGFYDTSVDTPESREMGLKIVWGGRQLKDAAGNDIQEWPEDDQDLEGRGYGPSDKEELEGSDVDSTQQCPFYQELPTPTIRHQHSMPALSTPYSENFPGADSSDSYFPTVAPFEKNNIGPLDLDPEDDRPVYGQVLEDPPSSLLLSSPAPSSVDNLKDSGQRRRVEDEEAALMHAMIEREDLVTNSPPPSSPISEGFKHEKQPTLGLGSVRVNVQGGTVVPAVIALVQPLLPSHLTSTATIANNSNTTSATADLTNSGDNHCNGNNNNEIISNGNNTSNSGANTNSNNNYNNKNSILDFQKQEVLATPTVVPVALHITIDAGVVPATAITNINNNISSTANSTKESSLPSPPTSDQKTRA